MSELASGTLAVRGTASLSAQEPWPGLAAFTEQDAKFFAARSAERDELFDHVRHQRLTVLYGLSGLGKTSLLQAGLFPALRDHACLPISVRLSFAEQAPSLVDQVFRAIEAASAQVQAKAPQRDRAETLWRYLFRKDNVFWSERNRLLVPVLVFDQFEEVFTLGQDRRSQECRAFLEALADIAEGRAPMELTLRSDASGPDQAALYDLRRVACRVVLSLREDFLAYLDDLRTLMPSVLRDRIRLRPFNAVQAIEVARGPGGELVNEDLALDIVRAVGGARQRDRPLADQLIDPPLLSLLCRELNQRRIKEGSPRIDPSWLSEQEQARILRSFYDRAVEHVSEPTKAFIEDELLLPSGMRNSVALETALAEGIPQLDIDRLIQERLLRPEDRGGVVRIELTHDVLAEPVAASRAQRRTQREAQARERAELETRQVQERLAKARRVAGLLIALALLLAIALGYAAWVKRQAEVARQRFGDRTRIAASLAISNDPTTRAALLREVNDVDAQGFVQGAIDVMQRPIALRVFDDFGGAALSAVLSRDGEMVVIASQNEFVRVWKNAADKTPLQLKHRGPVYAVALSSDGQSLLTGGRGGATLWETKTLQKRLEVTASSDLTSVAFSPNGQMLATGSMQGVQLWSEHGASLKTSSPSRNPVLSIAFSPDGGQLLAGGLGGVFSLWPIGEQGPYSRALESTAEVVAVAYHPRGLSFATGSMDEHARTWSAEGPVRSGNPIASYVATSYLAPRGASALTYSPDGNNLFVGSNDGVAREWKLNEVRPPREFWYSAGVSTVSVSANAPRLLTGYWDGTARLWSTSVTEHPRIIGHMDKPAAVSVSADGRMVAIAAGKHMEVWEIESGARVAEFPALNDDVSSLALSPDGSMLISGAWDQTVSVWEIRKPSAPLTSLQIRPTPDETPDQQQVQSIAFSATGRQVAVGVASGAAHIYEIALNGHLQPGPVLYGRSAVDDDDGSEAIVAVSFSPDGAMVATGSWGGTVRVWDLRDSKSSRPKLSDQHVGAVYALAFSSDGRAIISGSADGSLRRASLGTHQEVIEIGGRGSEVRSIAVSPDGQKIATGTKDGRVRIWSVDGKDEPLLLGQHPDFVLGLGFTPDGRQLIAGSSDIRVWLVDPSSLRDALWASTTYCLSSERRQYVLGETKQESELGLQHCLSQVAKQPPPGAAAAAH